MRANIDRIGQLRPSEHDQVPFKTPFAAGNETLIGGFLENTHHPSFRLENGVEAEHRSIHSHERYGRQAIDESASFYTNVPGLVFCALGPEISQAGGAAQVDCSLSGIEEQATVNANLAGTALGLGARTLGEARLAAKSATHDQSPVTANHVHCLATPASDSTALEDEIVHPGEFDGVEVPPRANVGDLKVFQADVVGWPVECSPIVDVDPVYLLALNGEVTQR
jgi:hypothetical protein